jgi:hypothetical protein
VFDLTILSNTGPCYSRICRTEVFCPCSLERHFQAPVQVDRSSRSSHDSRGPFILPSAVVSLLPLNQLVLLTVTRLSRVLDGIAVIGMMRMSTGVAHAGTWLVWRRAMEYISTSKKVIARAYHYCRILVVGRHQNEEGNNNTS